MHLELLGVGADLDMTDRTITLSDKVSISAASVEALRKEVSDLKLWISDLHAQTVVIISEFVDTMETSQWGTHATLNGAQYFDNTGTNSAIPPSTAL